MQTGPTYKPLDADFRTGMRARRVPIAPALASRNSPADNGFRRGGASDCEATLPENGKFFIW
jgi:hypothetical protein